MHPSRLVRAACASGAVVCGVLAVLSVAASAAGEWTTATLTSPTSGSSKVFTWSYELHQSGGPELSNLTIGFCDDSLTDHIELASQSSTRLSDGQITGEISVTLDQDYGIDAAGLLLQSDPGGGGDIETAPGPGPCPGTQVP